MKEPKIRYCWLKMPEGNFSNSWDEKDHDLIISEPSLLDNAKSDGYKLIEYKCINDPDFEFYNRMRLK